MSLANIRTYRDKIPVSFLFHTTTPEKCLMKSSRVLKAQAIKARINHSNPGHDILHVLP
jgi:hypothetical protein